MQHVEEINFNQSIEHTVRKDGLYLVNNPYSPPEADDRVFIRFAVKNNHIDYIRNKTAKIINLKLYVAEEVMEITLFNNSIMQILKVARKIEINFLEKVYTVLFDFKSSHMNSNLNLILSSNKKANHDKISSLVGRLNTPIVMPTNLFNNKNNTPNKEAQKNSKDSLLTVTKKLISQIEYKENKENNIPKPLVLATTNSKTNKCTVCLETVHHKATVKPCDHTYCKECIVDWAENSTSCPICKKNFNKIVLSDGKVLHYKKKSLKIKEEEDSEEQRWYENLATNCMICKGTDKDYLMLVCDYCEKNICHYYCDGLDKIPEGKWYCPECRKNRKVVALMKKENICNEGIEENKVRLKSRANKNKRK